MKGFSNINAKRFRRNGYGAKFLQMGITRARRYANHPSGRKYKKGTREVIPIGKVDEEKAESARIFSEKYYLAKTDEVYQRLMREHKEKYEKEN
jgi:hypothetical protein